MSIHIKDQEPETWAEIIQICEQFSGTNASELRSEICAVKNVTRQTVHNWIKQQDIRRCQTNANQSLLGQGACPLSRAEAAPLSESGGTVGLEFVS